MTDPYRFRYVSVSKSESIKAANKTGGLARKPPTPREVLKTEDIDFENVELVYLEALDRKSKLDEQKLTILEQVVNGAAIVIQRFWRKRRDRLRRIAAKFLQRWWRRKLKHLKYYYSVLAKLKLTYSKLKVEFALKKFIRRKALRVQEEPMVRFFTAGKIIYPLLRDKLILEANIKSEMGYIINLKNYNNRNFSREWENYEKQLRRYIDKQIERQWVRKGTTWIDESGRVRDKEAVVRREVEKIFNLKYEKYEQNQQELHKALDNLQQVELFYHGKYASELERRLKLHRVSKPARLL